MRSDCHICVCGNVAMWHSDSVVNMKRALLIVLLLPATARAEDPIEFNRDVRPILADACFKCHGLDPKARKAKLRLDVPEDAFKKQIGRAHV